MTPKEYTFDAAYQPQVRAKRGTREIMLDVIIALLPAPVSYTHLTLPTN